jgi:hypothetical protein
MKNGITGFGLIKSASKPKKRREIVEDDKREGIKKVRFRKGNKEGWLDTFMSFNTLVSTTIEKEIVQ